MSKLKNRALLVLSTLLITSIAGIMTVYELYAFLYLLSELD